MITQKTYAKIVITLSALLSLSPVLAKSDDTLISPKTYHKNTLSPALLNDQVPLNAISPDTVRNFVNVIDLVRRQYVEEVSDELLFEGAMRGALSELDGYGEFLDENAFRNLQAFTEGSVANIGLNLRFETATGQWVVKEVVSGSAAAEAGIKVGDYIHQINDKSLTQANSAEDIAQLLSGIAGSQITLVVSKAGRAKQNLRLQRTTPTQEKLSVMVEEDIVIVRLPIFTDKTRDELIEALAVINTPIKGMILDIRNNPGGVLSSAISTASLFTKHDALLKIVEKGKPIQTLGTKGVAALDKLPVVVIQNRYSASAAEVLAQALKHDKDSIIIGETSYGKGSIQSVIPLNNGTAVKLTTAYYLGIGDKKIDKIGVIPDTKLNFADPHWVDEAAAIMQARKLKQGMIIALPSDY